MQRVVQWSARELLQRRGFDDGMFVMKYSNLEGVIVSPKQCTDCDPATLGEGSFVPGDDYPDYVLCLIDLLRARHLKHIVLQDPEIGGHNGDMIQSFVFGDTLYVVDRANCDEWFASLPAEVQAIFNDVTVSVMIGPDALEERMER